MPWIKNGKEETFVFPEPRPVIRGPLPPGVEETDPAAHAQRRREHIERELWWKRVVVDWCKVYDYCPRKACRRSHACRSPTVACHDAAKPVLDELFYPRLRAALRSRRPSLRAAGEHPQQHVLVAGGERPDRDSPAG